MQISHDQMKLMNLLYANSDQTHQQLGDLIGKSRITVWKYLKSVNPENSNFEKERIKHPNREDNRIFFIEIKTNPEEPEIISKLGRINSRLRNEIQTKSIDGIIGNTSLMVKFQVENNEEFRQVLRNVDKIIANTRFQFYRVINVLNVFKEAGHVFSKDLSEVFSSIKIFYNFIPFTDYPMKWYLQLKPKILTEYDEIAENLLAPMDEIINLYRTGQEFGLLAVVRTKTKEEYRNFIQKIYSTKKFQDSHTIFVLDERMPSTFQPYRKNNMKIIKVEKSNKKPFFTFVEENDHEYFLLLMDYKLNPEHNHLFMAIDENQKIQGAFQILSGQIQVRGSKEAVETFFDYLDKEKIEVKKITSHLLHQDLLNKQFPDPKSRINKYRMIFSKQDQNLNPQYEYRKLEGSDENKVKIASLIRKADPKHWGKIQSNYLIVDEMRPYFAVMGDDKKILSLAGLWFDERLGLVNVVATHPKYRKKGYASSIISSSLEWLSQRTNKIIVDVRTDNKAAIAIYQKLGFRIAFEFQITIVKE
jgi:ribosomal protein S18 acetylase RimI-like enzyme/DNA-binding Lrp family transcriptional regulator